MANNFVCDAINLKSYPLSESDKIVVMYSKEKGLIKDNPSGQGKELTPIILIREKK